MLRYYCHYDRRTAYSFYEINKEDGSREFSITKEFFVPGEAVEEKEIRHLYKPYIVDYGNVYMVTQDFGPDGYFFIRFEENKTPDPNIKNNTLGVQDNNTAGSSLRGTLMDLRSCFIGRDVQ